MTAKTTDTTDPSATTDTSEDGRVARAERTRTAIVAAVIALLHEGDVQPTLERIAARAEVSERSIFQHFDDREALFAAVGVHQMAVIGGIVTELPGGGPLEDRLDAFVDQRARMLEEIAPVRRSALLNEPFSETIAAGLAKARGLARAEVERVFAVELDAMDAERRATALAAAAAASGFPAWESLRRHQGLSVEQSRAAMRLTLAALLGGG